MAYHQGVGYGLRPNPAQSVTLGALYAPAPPSIFPPVVRAPLYVTTPWNRWTAPDLFPNLAVLVALAATYQPPAPLDVPLFKRPAVQVDQFPNLAALPPPPSALIAPQLDLPITRRWALQLDLSPNVAVQFQTARPAGTYLDPTRSAGWNHTPDVLPNLAVNLQTQMPAGTYLDPPRYPRWPGAPDVVPNLAVNLQTITPAGTYLDPPRYRAPALWPDVYPNLAVFVQPVVYLPPAPIEPQLTRRVPPLVEQYQNLTAVNFTEPPRTFPTPVLDPQYWRHAVQLDAYPNLAVSVQPPPLLIPPPIEPQLWRRGAQPELFPNVAVNFQTQTPAGTYLDPPLWRHLAQPDLYPNVASSVPLVVYVPPAPIEPLLARHAALQLDVLPNVAALTTVAAPVLILPMIEPTYTHRWSLQIEYTPNLAVNFIPPVTPPGIHEINLGLSMLRLGGHVGST